MTKRPLRISRIALAALLAAAGSGTAQAQFGGIVHDPQSLFTQGLRHVEELGKLTEQIRTLEQQLAEAKRLYDAFNQLTTINDVAGLLARDEFRRYLPGDFAALERLIQGGGGDGGVLGNLVDGYLTDNRYYTGTGATGAEDFYRQELDRIARATGTKHAIGQQVFDTAAKRVDQLETLRTQISQTTTAAAKLDLSNRLQAETALLQNEVLRLQGLGMIQQARADMDAQRERERRLKLADEMKAAVQ